jgi:WD40 repeat protein
VRHHELVWAMVLLSAPLLRGQETRAVDFKRDVVPILRTYCLGCHQPTDRNGELSMHTFDELAKGGEHGPVFVAGKSAESRLYLMSAGKLEPKMPPEGNPGPTAAEIDVLARWIDGGASPPADPQEVIVGDPVVPVIVPKVTPRSRTFAAAWSSDGKRIALARYRSVVVIDPATNYIERTIDGLAGMVSDVSFSSDSAWLMTASGVPGVRGEAVIWKLEDGSREKTFAGHHDALFAARLSSDKTSLVTAGYDKVVLVWDVASAQIKQELRGHNELVQALAFRPGRSSVLSVLASVSGDRTLKLWDTLAGQRLDTLSESLRDLQCVTFSNDGAFVLAGGGDNRIRSWSVSASAKEGANTLVESRFAHEGVVLRLAMNPTGQQLASAGSDLLVKIWQWPSLREERVLERQSDWPSGLVFSPNGQDLLVARQDGSAVIYDPATGEKRRDVLPMPKPPPPPVLARVMPIPATLGQTVGSLLTGANLSTTREFKFSHPGLSAQLIPDQPIKEDQIWINVVASADVPLGRHELKVVTVGGETAGIAVDVDSLATLGEVEPNNDREKPMPIAGSGNIWGELSAPGDQDLFEFQARSGEVMVFDVASQRLASAANMVLTVSDETGRTLASNNDYLDQPDSFLVFTVPIDGKYRVKIHDLTFAGSAKHYYRLSYGPLAYATGLFPMTVALRAETKVEISGPNVPPATAVMIKPEQAGDFPLPIDGKMIRTRRPMNVLATTSPAVETEPNDEPTSASNLAVPGEAAGRIDRAGDADFFAVQLHKGDTWLFETDASRRGWNVDTRLDVLSSQGEPIERTWLAAVRDSYVEFRGIDSAQLEIRCKNWQEMELNQYLYMNGEVGKLFRHPRGPDSGFHFYSVGGQRRTYFDSSSSTHALEDPVYIVEPVAPGTRLVPNGLPVFKVYFNNDDGSDRQLKRDSQVRFTAPEDGKYLIRVVDVRQMGSKEMPYRLIVRAPVPDFQVTIEDRRPTLHRGSGREVVFRVDRRDGFEEGVDIDVSGLPTGYSISQPIKIEPGHEVVSAVLLAGQEAKGEANDIWAKAKVIARANLSNSPTERPVTPWEVVALAESPPLLVRVEPPSIVLAPGGTVSAKIIIDRKNHPGIVTFEMPGLPHGVIVDNIGLNGILIPEGQSEREFFLSARGFVEETDRPFFARSNEAAGQASAPILLSIRKPSQVAAGESK